MSGAGIFGRARNAAGPRLWCAAVIFASALDPKHIIESFGPWALLGITFIIFAETGLLLGFFLPGDSLLFTAGLLASQGDLNIVVLLVCCMGAAIAGGEVGYTIGRRVGPTLFSRPDSRLFKQAYVERTKEFFDRHGSKTIVLARFVPMVRTFTTVMAGVGEMPRRAYSTFNVIGAVLWAGGVTLAGYLLSEIVGDSVDKYLLPIIAVIVLASIIPPLLEARRHRQAHPVSKAEAEAEQHELEDLLDGD